MLAAYSVPSRAYHSLQHLNECLAEFDGAKVAGGMKNPDLLEMALWFHDAVYDSKSSQNEALSARMAMQALGDTDDAREVAQLIMVTQTHQPSGGADDAWIIDIDLSIFGQSPARIAEYEEQIREEYTWVPGPVYREKRAEILASFLSRERIYLTDYFHCRLDTAARKNLGHLITQLC